MSHADASSVYFVGQRSGDAGSSRSAGRFPRLAAGLILAAPLPLVVVHCLQLWQQRPHYEFFPFVIVAALWMLAARWPQPEEVHRIRTTACLGWGLLLAALLSLFVAVLLFSPSLGTLAWILALGGVLLLAVGRPALTSLAAPWALLWLIIPPPFDLDLALIRWLQATTSQFASWVLELRHIPHVLSGNIFELPGRELFVSEACSGVHSQLVLIAACLIVAVVAHRNVLHTALLVAAAIFWSIAANTTRVALVVGALARYHVDLTAGWPHELLGFVLVLGGLAMLLATDACLSGLFAPFNTLADWTHPWGRTWNHWVAGRPTARPAATASIRPGGAGLSGRWCLRLASLLFVVLGVLQIGALVAGEAALTSTLPGLAQQVTREWLPETIGDWRQADYTTKHRKRGSEFGEYSSIWQLTSKAGDAYFSLDHTFFGWHELSHCYAGRGWQIASRETCPLDGEGQYVMVDLVGPTGEHGLLLFLLVDETGAPLEVIHSSWKQNLNDRFVKSRLLGLFDGNERLFRAARVEGVQAQLFASSPVPFPDAERAEFQNLFTALQRQARAQLAGRASTEGALTSVEQP